MNLFKEGDRYYCSEKLSIMPDQKEHEKFKELIDEYPGTDLNLFDAIREAQNKMMQAGIEANTVYLNPRLKAIPTLLKLTENSIDRYPPKIFGMAAHIDMSIPDDTAFIVMHIENEESEEYLRGRRDLLNELRDMSFKEAMQFIFETE